MQIKPGRPIGHATRTFRSVDSEKIRVLYERFDARRMSEDVQAFEFGIGSSRVIVELALVHEQYRI